MYFPYFLPHKTALIKVLSVHSDLNYYYRRITWRTFTKKWWVGTWKSCYFFISMAWT